MYLNGLTNAEHHKPALSQVDAQPNHIHVLGAFFLSRQLFPRSPKGFEASAEAQRVASVEPKKNHLGGLNVFFLSRPGKEGHIQTQ